VKGHILAVDDDPSILEVIRLNLEAEGYSVEGASDARSALEAFERQPCVLAVLDVMLPDSDGFELARRLRDVSDIPIVMLSARDTDVDKAIGLGVGADDYMTKPFSPLELVARVKAHLRRYEGSNGRTGSVSTTVNTGPLFMDIGRRRVRVHDSDVELTTKEFDILRMLAEDPGRVYTKAQIYERVWGDSAFGDLSTVNVHVHRLRTKIESRPEQPELITTVWGMGYRFAEGA